MNIVVGVTPRPESAIALDRAIEEALTGVARLHIVRIAGEDLSESPGKAQAWLDRLSQIRSEGEQLVESLANQGVTAIHHVEPVATDAATTLLKVARDVDADLIIIGIRRRSPVGKLVLGSVSQDILLRADCPVLVVKAHRDSAD